MVEEFEEEFELRSLGYPELFSADIRSYPPKPDDRGIAPDAVAPYSTSCFHFVADGYYDWSEQVYDPVEFANEISAWFEQEGFVVLKKVIRAVGHPDVRIWIMDATRENEGYVIRVSSAGLKARSVYNNCDLEVRLGASSGDEVEEFTE